MNAAELLSRWSRRKRGAIAVVEATNSRGQSAPSGGREDSRPCNADPIRSAAGQTVSTSDLPSLVPLEAIGAETDIRAFLAAGVPPELARAALRRAWLSDPKIRNFVGLADYDWDFNAPGSMAGFGILDASDQAERELARLLRQAVAVTTGETPVSPTPIGELQTSDEVSNSATSCDLPGPHRLDDESAASGHRSEEPAERPFPHQRKHGRALPK
jgi:Protein of unknown function (DUF3306)